ncbi:MAG: dTDP-glucose 4,6-dehydratase [Patescibacteria group bacterium]|nr:MAG: dTDP-glucose 4,6-dehydratase [Patescibacteria group bacterium]
MRILVTGGAGFIGSAYIRYLLKHRPDVEVVNFDKLTYAGNLENLRGFDADPRYRFFKGDICEAADVARALQGVDAVVHFAAESHVDRSVLDPHAFFRNNVLGTQVLLEACRKAGVTRFHHVSTDEVYGDLALDEDRAFKETDVLHPRSAYAASKAGSDHVVMSYAHSFGMQVTISRCCNNYGTHQFPEKLIPLFTTNAMEDKPLPLFRSSKNTREWIHADDHSAAVDLILREGKIGEIYNIGTGVELSIEEITSLILETLGKPESLKTYVPDRPGHDRRYFIDSSKIKNELGWEPKILFEYGIRATILWYRDNPEWWKRVKTGEYQKYYDAYYKETLKETV